MQTATGLRVAMIVSLALAATSADAGRVRVSQEMEGTTAIAVQGFVKTFDRSNMTAGQVYAYTSDDPSEECQFSYGGNAFLPKVDATVMAVVDTSEGRTLFVIHNFPCPDPDGRGMDGAAHMLFTLKHDDDDSMACLVEDDDETAPEPDLIICEGNTAKTINEWQPQFTDGFVLGALDGRWQLDASFTQPPTGTSGVVVRSDGNGEVGGLSTNRTIRLDNVIEVGVDVQPGAEVGCLNIDGNGVMPVAIFGAADFDVAEIDVSTLALAGMLVRVRGDGEHQCAVERVNGDDHPDLACHFFDDPDAWTPGDAVAAVSGELLDTTPIYGEDLICVRPNS